MTMKRFSFRHIVFLALGICLLVVPTFGQTSERSQVRYNTLSHDFGRIQETAGPVSFTFEFTNTSREPFIIEFISVSCGCTTPQYSREPVLPGRSGSISVTFDPTGRPGAFRSPVIVTSNNRRDQVTLTLTGEVIPRPRTIEDQFPIELSPGGLRITGSNLLFGYVGRGSKRSQSLDLYNGGGAPVTLGYRLTSPAPAAGYSVAFTPAVLPPGQRGQVTFTYDLAGADVWGLQNVSFVLTEGGRATDKPLTAYATVTDDFSGMTEAQKAAAPKASFDAQFNHFGSVGRNRTLSHDFTLTNTGSAPLLIRHVRASGPYISYNVPRTSVASGESLVIRVTLRTPDSAERISESISIVLNDPARPMRELRVGANVE
jgi:hypothetical protein